MVFQVIPAEVDQCRALELGHLWAHALPRLPNLRPSRPPGPPLNLPWRRWCPWLTLCRQGRPAALADLLLGLAAPAPPLGAPSTLPTPQVNYTISLPHLLWIRKTAIWHCWKSSSGGLGDDSKIIILVIWITQRLGPTFSHDPFGIVKTKSRCTHITSGSWPTPSNVSSCFKTHSLRLVNESMVKLLIFINTLKSAFKMGA